MKIGTRLGLAFAVVLLLMMVVGGYAINRMMHLDEEIMLLAEDKYPKVIMLQQAKDNVNIIARGLRNMLLLSDQNEIAKEAKRVAESREKVGSILSQLEKSVTSETGKTLLKALIDRRTAYVLASQEVIKLIESGEKENAVTLLMTTVRKAQSAYLEAMDKMIEFESTGVKETAKLAERAAENARSVIIALLVVASLLSIVLAFVIVRGITGAVAKLVAANDRLANRDLTATVDIHGSDEIGQLADSSRKVIESMREMLQQVTDSSNQIASASIQLQATAEQIATGAEEVASQTSTVATASEEMAATSSDIARNCSMAAESSSQSSESATRGGAVVNETILGMNRIAERVKDSARTVESLGARSEQIGQIIGTIEDIADQTNLLALNAAIEAARAGEQGRGFAVVADEVRALAERTSRATREIGEMIKAIQSETKAAVRAMEEGVTEVERGAELSHRSSEALEMILHQISEVTMQINQIATAAEEQTATTSEITVNVQQVTEVVHQTANGAGDTAAAAAQLASNAQVLQELVRKFKL